MVDIGEYGGGPVAPVRAWMELPPSGGHGPAPHPGKHAGQRQTRILGLAEQENFDFRHAHPPVLDVDHKYNPTFVIPAVKRMQHPKRIKAGTKL
jgi:hypothetical protein